MASLADVITHEYFEQKQLYDEYIVPQICNTENKLLDEDENEDVRKEIRQEIKKEIKIKQEIEM